MNYDKRDLWLSEVSMFCLYVDRKWMVTMELGNAARKQIDGNPLS